MLRLYRTLTGLGAPLVTLLLARRRARGKEDPQRFAERTGIAGRPRTDAPLVWMHGASVGESLSLLPLIERLLADRPGLSVMVTTGTRTSAALMAERLPEGAFHQYVPVDRLPYVRRFLEHWRPGLAVWAESEFWPNLVVETARAGIPVVLVNGRISPRSFAGWQRFPALIRTVLGHFALCLGQTETDVQRLVALGAPQARTVGDLKFAAPPLPADPGELRRLDALWQGRPRWLAASTHAGEETLCATAHKALRGRHSGLLTVIAPRHPERGAAVCAEIEALGLRVARRSAGEEPGPDTEVYIADTLGELGLFFRLADVVFMGKSLVDLGGQNPIEPARLGRPIVHGPHMWNFPHVVARLAEAGGAREAPDASALSEALDTLLDDEAARMEMGAAARSVAEAEAGVIDRLAVELAPFLDHLERTEAARARA